MKYFIIDNWKLIVVITILAVYAIVVFSIGFVIGQAAFYIVVIGTGVIKAMLFLKDLFCKDLFF